MMDTPGRMLEEIGRAFFEGVTDDDVIEVFEEDDQGRILAYEFLGIIDRRDS